MPRGRRKQTIDNIQVEVRESTEAEKVEKIERPEIAEKTEKTEMVSAKRKSLIETFLDEGVDPGRNLREIDEKNIIALANAINKYTGNIFLSMEISEKYIRNVYKSIGCLRIYSKKFFGNDNVRLYNMDVRVEVKPAQPNVAFKIKAVYLTYDYNTNEGDEREILVL